MVVEKLVVGLLEANCYIVADEETKDAVIIDPGADAMRIKSVISRLRLKPGFIINTHGHADHIGANGDMGLPIMIHRLDKEFLDDPGKNLSASFAARIVSPPASRLLNDGDVLAAGRIRLHIIHTPGHTPGCISIKADNAIFTGDTLFNKSVGRTDLPGSDEEKLLDSIRKKLLVQDDRCVIYPGHGPCSTIGEEKRHNPFL